MPDFDLAKLPDLLARLDEAPRARSSSRMEPLRNDIIRAWIAERAESAAAIRALMAENSILIAAHDAQAFDIANAVAAEREACAKVCDYRAEQIAARNPKTIEAATEYEVWLQAARMTRARGDA